MWRIWKLYDPLRAMVAQGVFPFFFGRYDPFDFVKHKSIQMVRWYVTGAVYAVSRCGNEVIGVTKPWWGLVTTSPSKNL